MSDAIDRMGLKWDKMCGITTDGAPAMAGQKKGMASMVCAKVQQNGGEAVKLHCVIHQESLCAKRVQHSNVMNTVANIVNIIRSHGLYHKQFWSFLSDVDAECGDVLYHCSVHWLSCGAVLQRYYFLRSEIFQFLKVKDQPFDEQTNP